MLQLSNYHRIPGCFPQSSRPTSRSSSLMTWHQLSNSTRSGSLWSGEVVTGKTGSRFAKFWFPSTVNVAAAKSSTTPVGPPFVFAAINTCCPLSYPAPYTVTWQREYPPFSHYCIYFYHITYITYTFLTAFPILIGRPTIFAKISNC